jgi:hypothetical protein
MAKTGAKIAYFRFKKISLSSCPHVAIAAEVVFQHRKRCPSGKDADIWDEMLLETYKVLIY